MTKRKLRGPASVRNKAKKSKPEVSDSPETALEVESKPSDDAPQPPATILKEEGQAALMADENSILKRMAELEEEMEQESGDVAENGDEDEDVENTKRISGKDQNKERPLDMNDAEHEGDDDDDKQGESKSEVKGGSEEHLSEVMKTMLTQKDKTIKSLEGKIRSLEAEKAELSIKYKKYKDMAVKLTKEKGAGGKGFGGDNKDLEEENQELKMKLRSVLDDLKDKEESKGDVRSKLSLKDHLLQQQIIKNEELELKFKNFLMKFHEKFSKGGGGGGSLTENASSILKSSLQESKVQEHLSNTTQPGELPKRVPKTDKSSNKTPTVTNPLPKAAEAVSKEDKFKESLESRLSKVQKSASEVNKNPNNKSMSKKVIASKPGVKCPDGEGEVGDRTSKTSHASRNLNISLPLTSSNRGLASRRRSVAPAAPVSASNEPEKSKKENTPVVTKTQVPAHKGKPDKNLPSKLLANSSISIGRQEKPIPKGVSLQESSSPIPSSASAKLSKLSGSSLSISSSPSNIAPTPKVNLPLNSSISMIKSAPTERADSNNPKGKGTPNTSKLLKNSGISFSKVSTDAASVPNSPVSKPAPPARSLSSLKGLNISLSKPEGDDNGEQSSVRGGNAASKQTTVTRSLAIVPTEAPEENEEPKSPAPHKSTEAKKRGPTSARRKAPLPQSNKLSFAKKGQNDNASDEKLLDESSAEGESLRLTFQAGNDSESHSVSIPVEDNILKELSFDSALDFGSVDKEAGGGEAASYESLLSRVSSELDSITKTNKKDKEKMLMQSDEKLLL